MKYHIFNGKKEIEIPEEFINLYEKNVAPFHEERAEYLAITSDVDENNTEEEIVAGIIEGICDEVEVYQNKDFIIQKARDMELI